MEVHSLELPLKAVQASAGFALDIGGSVAKLVYRSKKDFDNGVPKDKEAEKRGRGKVCMVLVAREKIDDMVSYIAENCDLSKREDGEKLVAYSTGLGGQQFKTKIENGLNVKMENVAEFACFVNATCLLLKELSPEELFKPVDEAGIEGGKDFLQFFFQFKKASEQGSTKETDLKDKNNLKEASSEVKDDESPFPFMLATVGSAWGLLKVEADGCFELFEGGTLCGRFFHGLSSYLAGEKDFSKISQLIEESDGKTVDTLGSDIIAGARSGDSMYSSMAGDLRLFPFGKMLTDKSDQAKRGDLVHSLLETMCENMAQMAYLCCRLADVKKIYFAGNFVNIPKCQTFLTKMLYMEQHRGDKFIPFEFLNNGGHMGAIGALLETYRRKKAEEDKAEVKER